MRVFPESQSPEGSAYHINYFRSMEPCRYYCQRRNRPKALLITSTFPEGKDSGGRNDDRRNRPKALLITSTKNMGRW